MSALVDYIPVDTIVVGTRKGIVTQPINAQRRRTSTQIPVPVQPATLRTLSHQTDGALLRGSVRRASPASLTGVYEDLQLAHDRRPTGRTS